MSNKLAGVFALALICIGFTIGSPAAEPKVDPCQYGCPKSGCPQCPEGGPVEKPKEETPKPAPCSDFHFECTASDQNGICVQHKKVCDN